MLYTRDKHRYNESIMKRTRTYHRGEVDGWMISTIGLIVLVIGAGSLAIWAVMNYQEQKTNVDGKIERAVTEGKKEQLEEDEEKFAEREKEPRRDFVSPDDVGRLTFTYPKTWSVYVDQDPVAQGKSGGDYKAYLHPITVPPVDIRNQQFAVRVSILSENYNEYLKGYERDIDKGELRSSTVTVNGENGVRLDGNFSKEIRGSAVIFKIRDKTAVVQSDADTFRHDFNDLIKTIKFLK